MPRDSFSQADAFALTMALGAPERAAHYRQEAERFRQLAEIETNDRLRGSLLDIATQYDELAGGLVPGRRDGA